jgi:DNA-binding transcriptional ArsR family regulator
MTLDGNAVRSVDRAAALLLALGESHGEAGVTELARRLGLHKSTASRLLATLEKRGLVEQDEESGRYRLGLIVLRLAETAERTLDLRALAMPELDRLARATRETTGLGVAHGDRLLTVAQADGPNLVAMGDWTGRSVPTRDGVYFRLCDRGSLRPCSLGRGAKAARAQAFELARTTMQTTAVSLVLVALPQSATRSALLVFERDVLAPGLDPLRATAERLYLMGGLVPYSDTEDSLLLVRLRPSPAERPGR